MKKLSVFSQKVGAPILVASSSVGSNVRVNGLAMMASSWSNSGWNNYSDGWLNSGWNNYSDSWQNSGWNNYSSGWTNSGWNNSGGK